MRVIAIACDGEPLDRICTGSTSRVTYIVRPAIWAGKKIPIGFGVGFPKKFVFPFVQQTWDQLTSAYLESGNEAVLEIIAKLTPVA